MKAKPYTYDSTKGYHLDTDAKVQWANTSAPRLGTEPYKLFDHCYYVPTEPIREPMCDGY